jgi:hypothetical protein
MGWRLGLLAAKNHPPKGVLEMLHDTGLDWISTGEFVAKVEFQAGLAQVNWHLTFNQNPTKKNLARQKKLAAEIEENKNRLSQWVSRATLSNGEKTILRSMYLQYTRARDQCLRNVQVIEQCLAAQRRMTDE